MSSSKKTKPAAEPKPDVDRPAAAESERAKRTLARGSTTKRTQSAERTQEESDRKRARRQRRREKRRRRAETAEPDQRAAAPAQAQSHSAKASAKKGRRKGREEVEAENKAATKDQKKEKKKRRKVRQSRKGERQAARVEDGVKSDSEQSEDQDQLEDALDGGADAEADSESEGEGGQPSPGQRSLLVSPLLTSVIADNSAAADFFFERLKAEFADADIRLISAASDARLIVALGHDRSGEAPGDRRVLRVILEEPGHRENDGGSLKALAGSSVVLLPVANLLRRFPEGELLGGDGNPTAAGLNLLAGATRDAVLVSQGTVPVHREGQSPAEPDAIQALSLAENAADVLDAMTWRSTLPPNSIRAVAIAYPIESFLDGAIGYRDGDKNQLVPLPFDWTAPPANRNLLCAAHGLDFVAGVLTYWFQKASKSRSKRIAQIDALVKQKNATASAILDQAGRIIAAIADCSAQLPKEAWQLNIAMRRTRAMLLYLLCCRIAAQRKIKFDETFCPPIFRSLVAILDDLRWAGYYRPGTARAVALAVNIAGLALPLRKTPFGANLLRDALEAVQRHLALGLSPDGVWNEGFAGHDSVFQSLRKITGDLRAAHESPTELAAAMSKMAQFTSAFLRDDASPPPLTGLLPKKYRSSHAIVQRMLRGGGAKGRSGLSADNGLQEARLFPEAGYFVTRSSAKKGGLASHLVLCAAPTRLGGISLSFTCGSSVILIGGGTNDRKAPAEVRRATLCDPGAHNAVRVDDLNYKREQNDVRLSVQIERAWEEKSWAAARLINRYFQPATIVRTVIHLKPLHAVLAVDELHSEGEQREFEQFWHLAPALKPKQRLAHQFRFGLDDPQVGGVVAAFDDSAPAVPRSGGPEPIGWTSAGRGEVIRNLYFVRTLRTADAVVAAFFRCTASTAKHEISVERMSNGWKAGLMCEGRQITFASEGGQLKLVT